MDAEFVIGKVPKVIKIERIHASPVSGVTDDGEEVVEDNLHLELRNVGKKTLSFIDCTISYKDKKGATLGKDSDGSFDECKPKETYKFSIPFFVPEETVTKTLDIIVTQKESTLERIFIWLVGLSALYGFIRYLSG